MARTFIITHSPSIVRCTSLHRQCRLTLNYVSLQRRMSTKASFSMSLDQTGPQDVALEGKALLVSPQFNKGTAFTREERRLFKLHGLLPCRINTLEQQLSRAYGQYQSYQSDILKNAFLHSLHDQNQVLFFRLLHDHLVEMLPIIYTPVQGDAIQAYSKLFRRPEGCFLNIGDEHETKERLAAWGGADDIDYIVVTDGESILGIGDQGGQGIGISMAKLTIPVVLDVGTDNEELLSNDLYLGLPRRRAKGEEYDHFLETFVRSVQELFPKALLHFEDFGLNNARRLLEKYQPQLACFNDDIQGTGCVAQAAIKAAVWVAKGKITEQKMIVYGAGTAGTGIADQVRDMMVLEGLSKEQATKQIWLVDRYGLCMKRHGDKLTSAQKPFARDDDEFPEDKGTIDLLTVIKRVKPNILVGCSTRPGSFTKEIVQEMASHVDRPIIFPLSNPTRLHEAKPEDLNDWTQGKALIATGSPFPPVYYNGKEYDVAECNNVHAYPGIGLACVLSRTKLMTDEMIVAAAHGLAELSPALQDPDKALLPDVRNVRETSINVAAKVIQQCVKEGLNRVKDIPEDENELKQWIEDQMWKPEYREFRKVDAEQASREARGELGIKGRASIIEPFWKLGSFNIR